MKLLIDIDLGNDAMQTPADASHAIQKALANGGGLSLFEPIPADASGLIRDGNGNMVGEWEVVPS